MSRFPPRVPVDNNFSEVAIEIYVHEDWILSKQSRYSVLQGLLLQFKDTDDFKRFEMHTRGKESDQLAYFHVLDVCALLFASKYLAIHERRVMCYIMASIVNASISVYWSWHICIYWSLAYWSLRDYTTTFILTSNDVPPVGDFSVRAHGRMRRDNSLSTLQHATPWKSKISCSNSRITTFNVGLN